MRRMSIASAVIAAALMIVGSVQAQTAKSPPPGTEPSSTIVPAEKFNPAASLPYQPPDVAKQRGNAPSSINCVPSVVPSTGSLSTSPPGNQPCR